MGTTNSDKPRLSDVVTTEGKRAEYLRAGLWDGSTLVGRVAEVARSSPESLAVVDLGGERSRTYGELEADAAAFAERLRDLGVEPGEVVSVQLPNWYETTVVFLAVLKVGAVLNSVLPIYRAKELRYMLNACSVRVLVTPGAYRSFDHAAMAAELREGVPSLEHHLEIGDPLTDPERLRAPGPPSAAAGPGLDPAAVSELIFTSGTEARPKAVMHTETNANCAVRATATSLSMGAGDVVWMPSPIGHSTGLNFGVRMALYHGLPLVLQDRWNPAEAASLIERFRCSYTLAATTFLRDLLLEVEANPADLSSMRLFGSGGAPVPPELVAAANEAGVTVLRLYGSTEVLVATCNRPASPWDKRLDTDGPAIDGVEIEVRDEDGSPLIGAPGEIFTRGPTTSVGFFDDPERTAASYLEGGWVRSGDLGVLDEDGFLTIVGRKKEIIIRGGLNIAPREIEDAILEHPDVADVAVVGIPDERLGEIACACLVAQGDAELTEAGLVEFLSGHGMATFKLPQRLELFASLPRTSTGKIQKFKILAEVERRSPQGSE